jgi:serine/threonine protein kinase/tetratricopeptide (TPR) repeat protein/WD40 repeat protein
MNVPLQKLLETQTKLWQGSVACNIQELLASFSLTVSELSSHELLDLVCNEVHLRESAGQFPTLEEYQQQFPGIHRELATQWQVNAFLDTTLPTPADSPPKGMPNDWGRYEVFREVGRGAMGIVYEAYDRQVRRIVALKCLRREFGRGSTEFGRFQREAEAIGQFNHPNLVQIYDFGFHNDTPYIAMEYCSGGTLADRMSEPISTAETVDILISIASSVGVAHAAGIIHRDLKPANILLSQSDSPQPQYKVSDFGLAKLLNSLDSVTLTGSILGSPAYMSPEQAGGDKASVSPASDVYSLGAILFQCLTSRPPFVGDSVADVLYQVQNCEPLRLRQLNPRTPRPLETIVAKCLSKHPGTRYSHATDLRDDLIRFRSGLAIYARPERLDQKLRRLALRHKLSTFLISVSMLLVLGLMVSSLAYSMLLRAALTESEGLARRAMLEKAEGLLGKANGHRVSNRSGRRMLAQDILREAIQIGKDLQQPTSWFAPYRDEAIETMWLSDLCIRKWRKFPREIQYADLSPSGRLACIVYQDGDIEVILWDSGTLLINDTLSKPAHIAFLDEEYFLALDSDSVKCFHLSSNALQQEWIVNHRGGFGSSYWLNRRHQRLFVAVDNYILSIDARTGLLLDELPRGEFKDAIEIAFHPQDEIYLITSYGSGVVEVRNLDNHQVLFHMKYPVEFNGALGAAWSPSGTQLMLADGDANFLEIYDWDRAQQTVRLTKRIEAEEMSREFPGLFGGARLRWPENSHLLSVNWTNEWGLFHSDLTRDILKIPATVSLTNFSNLPLQFPAASHRIALAGSARQGRKEAGLLEVVLGDEKRLHNVALLPTHNLAISHDGAFAVFQTRQKLQFLDLATGAVIGDVDLQLSHSASIALDGLNNLYVVTPDYSLKLELDIDTTRIVLKSARRVSIPSASPALKLSSDGRTAVVGYWDGYHDAAYAGVWVKTPAEPMCRKIIHGQKGMKCAVDGSGKHMLCVSDWNVYRMSVPELRPALLCRTALEHPIQFTQSGEHAVAGGELWETASWRSVKPTLASLTTAGATANGFSHDSSQAIYNAGNSSSLLLRNFSGDVYLQMEGEIVYYDSHFGRLLMVDGYGLHFRDLRNATGQLDQLGIRWEGPAFSESPPSRLQRVELSPELAGLKGYSQWMDYLDERALLDAQLYADDGHSLFQAARVEIERGNYVEALELLERCSQLLPDALTPIQWKAYVLAELQRWDEAIASASRFIDVAEDVELRLHRAAWCLEVDLPHQSLEDAELVLKQNESLLRRAQSIQVLAYQQLGDASGVQAVQAEISKNQISDVRYAEAVERMTISEISLRHVRLAEFYGKQLVESSDAQYRVPRAWLNLRRGNFEDALALIDPPSGQPPADPDSPEFANSVALKVICHAKLGNWEIAHEHARLLPSLQPVNCTGNWHTQARRTRLLLAEATKIVQQNGGGSIIPTTNRHR